jgi:hypothetical protein
MTANIVKLAEMIERSMEEAFSAFRAFGNELENVGWSEPEEPTDTYEDAEGALGYHLEAAFREMMVLAERLDLSDTRSELAAAFAEQKKRGLARVQPDPMISDYVCQAYDVARTWWTLLQSQLPSGLRSALDIFENILASTPLIIRRADKFPTKEAEVRREVLPILQYAFPDTLQDAPNPKPLKVYKADFGIPSIKAMAEYKFADDESEVTKSIDELAVDMKGYSGSDEWVHFYAIIYQTAPYSTRKLVDAQVKSLGANAHWKVILVTGPGARKK